MDSTFRTSGYRRADLRLALDAEAVLAHDGKPLAVRLQDLSRSGAALTALPPPPPRESVVMLELGGRAIAARVAWTSERSFGLRFDARLRATEVFLLSNRCRAGAAA